jgi:hypothetical protein
MVGMPYTFTYMHTCIHAYIHTYVCMYLCMYVCMYHWDGRFHWDGLLLVHDSYGTKCSKGPLGCVFCCAAPSRFHWNGLLHDSHGIRT